MPLYEYECKECKESWEQELPVDERNDPCLKACDNCLCYSVIRVCGNKGGFRLSTKGTVSWAKGGYSTHLGDIVKHERVG